MVPPLNSKTIDFLRCASETWMPGPTLEMVMLIDCHGKNASLRRTPFLTARQLPVVHPRCFRGQIQINFNDFDKEATLLDELLRVLSHKKFYMKIDLDIMLMPSNLFNFLALLRPKEAAPLYFGSNEIATRIQRCSRCFLNSPGWLSISQHFARELGNPDFQTPNIVTYAQGGAQGFSSSALKLLVSSGCVRKIGDLPCQDGLCIHKKEDATVGLCMLALQISLINCKCFHAWGPCNIYNTTSCLDHDNKSRLCRYPITIHKLKRLQWYRKWWRWLRDRG